MTFHDHMQSTCRSTVVTHPGLFVWWGNTLCQLWMLEETKTFVVLTCTLNILLVLHSPISLLSPSLCKYFYPVWGYSMTATIVRCWIKKENCLYNFTGDVCREKGAGAFLAFRDNFRMTWMVIMTWTNVLHLYFDERALEASSFF